MTDCLFCKIVAGEIPSAKVYEDDVCYAFDDIEPEAPVHTLIVPKEHYDNLQDDVPAELLGHLLSVVPKVAALKGVDETASAAWSTPERTRRPQCPTCTSMCWAA